MNCLCLNDNQKLYMNNQISTRTTRISEEFS